MLIDRFGRAISYLRLSVTDRCDLRCSYCLPPEFDDYESPADWLQFDEQARIARIFVELGVQRIRLTGGEPLTRARFPELAAKIRATPGLADLSVSTNGTRLKQHAAALAEAGVDRLNVSLDTLNRARCAELTQRDALPDILEGLEAARLQGFQMIKINMVWMPETNGDEVDAMIDFCRTRNFILRLIETMPMGDSARQVGSRSLQPLITELRQKHNLVDHVISGGGPARYLASSDGQFSLGFITPISQHFCETCNRVRLTTSGTLHLCLGQEDHLELRPLLRDPSCDDETIKQRIRAAVQAKPWRHEFNDYPQRIVRFMSSTGG